MSSGKKSVVFADLSQNQFCGQTMVQTLIFQSTSNNLTTFDILYITVRTKKDYREKREETPWTVKRTESKMFILYV